jgi:hypothetical protein
MTCERVAVVIPAYHVKDTIERAVRSVLAQPRVTADVIVVVDDEQEATQAALRRVEESGLRVLTNPMNLGAPKTRNRGLAEVDAPYVMFLDGDDFVMGDLLPGLVDALASGADIAFGPWLLYDEARNRTERRQEQYDDAAHLLDRWLLRQRWTPPCAVLWRTQFLRKLGGWNESVRRNQDGELVCRAALAGANLSRSTRGCGVYVQHTSPFRITGNRSTFGDLIDVAESLLVQPSTVIGEAERRRIIGDYFYWLADCAFRRGNGKEGRHALARAVRLGGQHPSSSAMLTLGLKLIGLENYRRASAWLRAG